MRLDDVITAHKTGTTIAQDAWLDRLARLAAEARRPPSVLDDPTLMQPGAAVKAKNGYRTSEQGFNYGEYA